MIQLHIVMTFVIGIKIDLYSSYLFASVLFTFLRRLLCRGNYCFLLSWKRHGSVTWLSRHGFSMKTKVYKANLAFIRHRLQ